ENSVSKCLINSIFVDGTVESSFTQNTITVVAEFVGLRGAGLVTNDRIANNTFATLGNPPLQVSHNSGTLIIQNAFLVQSSPYILTVTDSGTTSHPLTIANNRFTTLNTDPSTGGGIEVVESAASEVFVNIRNNAFEGTMEGPALALELGINSRVLIEGNDFHNRVTGVFINGDGTSAGIVDLGGGQLGSLGGNDFRGFTIPDPDQEIAIGIDVAGDTIV